jgi:hypothetical protein
MIGFNGELPKVKRFDNIVYSPPLTNEQRNKEPNGINENYSSVNNKSLIEKNFLPYTKYTKSHD